MKEKPVLVLIRRDFRFDDNKALFFAAQSRKPLVVVFVLSRDQRPQGEASRAWLHAALCDFQKRLKKVHVPFVIRQGDLLEEIVSVVQETNASAVYCNREYEATSSKQEAALYQRVKEEGALFQTFQGNILFEPWKISTQSGSPYLVFTPYYHAALKKKVESAVPTPDEWIGFSGKVTSLEVSDLALCKNEYTPLHHWRVGEEAVRVQPKIIEQYAANRDFVAIEGTTRLAPSIHFGHISVIRLYEMLHHNSEAAPFLRQLFWRDFAYHLLFHFPDTVSQPLRSEFSHFPWREDEKHLQAWKNGKTGYPIVDAAMRQLLETGWMHNRARMIVGSFLVKHLRIHWKEGEAWFWQKLFDADLANNIFGWQWIAGCGADAAPYFRIFNPIIQSEKFDPDGAYIRKYLPELSHLDAPWIHTPWLAPEHILRAADVVLGKTYPYPLVDHYTARNEALEAYQALRGQMFA